MPEATLEMSFAEFFRDQYRSIVTEAFYILGNRDLAIDIADEAFFRAYIRWKKISRYDQPGSWLRRVTIRLSTRFLAKSRRHTHEFADVATNDPDRESHLDLRRAVLTLAPSQRAAIVLHYYDDLPVAEVAEMMGCKESTVKRYLHDGRTALRKLLTTVGE